MTDPIKPQPAPILSTEHHPDGDTLDPDQPREQVDDGGRKSPSPRTPETIRRCS